MVFCWAVCIRFWVVCVLHLYLGSPAFFPGYQNSEEMKTKHKPLESEDKYPDQTCADCETTKTPLCGEAAPAGPKEQEKRRALLGLNKDDRNPRKQQQQGTRTIKTAAITVEPQKAIAGVSAARKSRGPTGAEEKNCVPPVWIGRGSWRCRDQDRKQQSEEAWGSRAAAFLC
nr:GATA transcription factor 15-like [Ipomoea batatas]